MFSRTNQIYQGLLTAVAQMLTSLGKSHLPWASPVHGNGRSKESQQNLSHVKKVFLCRIITLQWASWTHSPALKQENTGTQAKKITDKTIYQLIMDHLM
jgi:hypothetical protein